jgi:hypothetical protein
MVMFFKVFLTCKYIKIIFLKKKLFLTLTHQNNLKFFKKLKKKFNTTNIK